MFSWNQWNRQQHRHRHRDLKIQLCFHFIYLYYIFILGDSSQSNASSSTAFYAVNPDSIDSGSVYSRKNIISTQSTSIFQISQSNFKIQIYHKLYVNSISGKIPYYALGKQITPLPYFGFFYCLYLGQERLSSVRLAPKGQDRVPQGLDKG